MLITFFDCECVVHYEFAPKGQTMGCDFWMFPKLKIALKGKRFNDIKTIQSNATRELRVIPKSAFADCRSTAGSVWFDQMRTTSEDATFRMTKNSTNAEIWTQVG